MAATFPNAAPKLTGFFFVISSSASKTGKTILTQQTWGLCKIYRLFPENSTYHFTESHRLNVNYGHRQGYILKAETTKET